MPLKTSIQVDIKFCGRAQFSRQGAVSPIREKLRGLLKFLRSKVTCSESELNALALAVLTLGKSTSAPLPSLLVDQVHYVLFNAGGIVVDNAVYRLLISRSVSGACTVKV